MGQGNSIESQASGPNPNQCEEQPSVRQQPTPRRFSLGLPSGLSNEQKKSLYEKEISRLFNEFPEGGQEKFRAEHKGYERTEINEQLPAYKEVVWEDKQQLFDVCKEGQAQRTFKKMVRSKADVWRKHGALQKLHEIGGKAYNGPPGPKAKYFDVKAGITPPPNPVAKPLSTVDDYRPFGGLSAKAAEE